MKLSNKIALVTGGSSGIGLAAARLFHAEGARVAITGRDEKKLEIAAREIGSDVLAVRADAGDVRATEAAVARVVERFGALDVVFANAGIAGSAPFGQTTIASFEEVLRINVTGVFFTVQAAAPHLREGGSVILNGSVHAVMGMPGYAAYAASKAAVRALARTLASELAPRRIRANVVVPGGTRTPIWDAVAPNAEARKAIEARIGQMAPLGRMAEAEEVARVALFLASDDASMITGGENRRRRRRDAGAVRRADLSLKRRPATPCRARGDAGGDCQRAGNHRQVVWQRVAGRAVFPANPRAFTTARRLRTTRLHRGCFRSCPRGGPRMKTSTLLFVGASALAGCAQGDPDARERTAEAVARVESLTSPSQPNSIRYLEQSTFGPTASSATHVMSVGITGAITEQLAAPVSHYQTAWPDATTSPPDLGAQFFVNALTKPDQLRQRVAFALSQIIVVSLNTFTGLSDKGFAAEGGYLNVLADDAFGNFRALLRDITINPAMGRYLDMVNNNAFNTAGTPLPPNENYARELLQLFTVGLYLLNDDGTLKLDAAGQPQPTYTQDEVENLSHVLTGWTYGHLACPTKGKSNGVNTTTAVAAYSTPLIPCDVNHDPTPQSFLGGTTTGTLMSGQTSLASQNLDEALDIIFKHPNLPPFICKQLIQHLVTSNPSPAYVGRVVAKFKNDGSTQKVRGNMAVVVRAILEDAEARGPVPPFAQQATFGHLREPALFLTNVLRWTNATVTDGAKINSYSSSMGQSVPRPASVFSYYPPNEPLPGSSTLVGPEFGINNTSTMFGRANFLNALLFTSGVTGTTVNLSGIPSDANGLLAWLDTYMLHGTMSNQLKAIVLDAITDATLPAGQAQPLGIYLVAVSPEFQIQR
ncbi:MAG: DUF1800 family protein [Minicystis sp.]